MKEIEEVSPFTSKVIEIISAIPRGRVMSYGLIAEFAENRRGARQVARILHTCSAAYDLPWHRVVNQKGRISLKPGSGYERQKNLLAGEGVVFDRSDTIDERFFWRPLW